MENRWTKLVEQRSTFCPSSDYVALLFHPKSSDTDKIIQIKADLEGMLEKEFEKIKRMSILQKLFDET